MRTVLLLLFAIATVRGLPQTANSECPPTGTQGQWSSEATRLCPQYKGRDYTREMRLESPDQGAVLRVGYDTWSLEIGGKRSALSSGKDRVAENAELGWGPDGREFYLTQSENRAGVQGFHTEAYRINGRRIERMADINEIVQHEFNRHHKCETWDANNKRYVEEADIGAVKWVDSGQLLVVAEVTYDSSCDRGYFAGYLVSLSERKVVQRYSARELTARWETVLGSRLKADFQDLTAKQKDALP
jgi:hypothetical protein